MNSEACKVCGSTDLNLIDGFYYCVECGTQDVNMMDTMIDEMPLSDGTFHIKMKKVLKITRVVEDVSPEWYKWQAYNYILCGMVKEMMVLGAGPKFKMRIMWLWTLYIKKFQKKQELGLAGEDEEIDSTDCINRILPRRVKENSKVHRLNLNISRINVNLFVTLIYLALNFDRSNILLTDLIRYIREGRLSFGTCKKYIPEEINVNLVKDLKWFHCVSNPNVEYIASQAMTVLKTFDLGPPIVPDLGKIVQRLIKELCLPDGFKDLVLSLMDVLPCDYLEIDKESMKYLNTVPFFEGRVMAYIIVALKMCFGLDDDYEIKLSDAVDRINTDNGHVSSHKLGTFSTKSDKLFCFRDWVKFLQLRKLVLSRCYVPMSLLYRMEMDDYVYMEQRNLKIPHRKQPSLTDNVIMSLLEKIKTEDRKDVIPKCAFEATLTPLTSYTDVILNQHHNSEIRLLLSEDFTQYSLKYAYKDLDLRVSKDSANIIVGVDDTNKCVKREVLSKVSASSQLYRDDRLVYVRNCENKHWLKTKRPKKRHIKIVKNSDSETDSEVSSNSETGSDTPETDSSDEDNVDTEKKLESIEEDVKGNIFDDDFHDLEDYEEKNQSDLVTIKEEPIDEIVEQNSNNGEAKSYNFENSVVESNSVVEPNSLDSVSLDDDNIVSLDDDNIENLFNSETFNREETIKELVLLTCKKYKIPLPKEYRPTEIKEPRKRKVENVDENGDVAEKKPKTQVKRGYMQEQVNELLSAYYNTLKDELISSVAPLIRQQVEALADAHENQVDGEFKSNIIDLDLEDHGHDLVEENTENNAIENFHESNISHDNQNDTRVDYNQDNIDDPSLVEIQSETLNESDNEDVVNAYKGDPKFDDKIYDIKQLYLEVAKENFEDIFDIRDDPEVDKILTKKLDELTPAPVESKTKESFDDWDDDLPLSVIKEGLLLNRKEERKEDFVNLKYLVPKRRKIKNKYWIRREKIVETAANRVDTFTNVLKECFPRSFSFLLIECAAMLDCTPFILYKYISQIEKDLINLMLY